jgi:hypothetical protein
MLFEYIIPVQPELISLVFSPDGLGFYILYLYHIFKKMVLVCDLLFSKPYLYLKKTKPLSEAQKEAVCIVNIIRGIDIFSLGSDRANIFATWAFNNRDRNPIPLVSLWCHWI